jgi:gamma-glutamylputrescine oxidase
MRSQATVGSCARCPSGSTSPTSPGPRLYALGGYNGTGHVQGFVAARIVGELIVDGASRDAWLYQPVG